MPHKQTKNPFMFKLSKDGKVFYILGTNHAIPLEVLPDSCYQIIGNTKHLYQEVHNFFPAPGGIQNYPRKRLTTKDLDCLGLIMEESDEDWYSILSRTQKMVLNTVWQNIKEYYPVGIEISRLKITEIKSQVDLYKESHGMDSQIEKQHFDGKNKGSASYALDERSSTEDVINFPDEESLTEDVIKLDEAVSISILKDLLSNLDFNPIQHKEFYSGKLREALIEDNFNISKRNKQWERKLSSALRRQNGQILVVVGSAHLGTKDGLLANFSRLGYKVQRMSQSGVFNNCIYNNPSEMDEYYRSIEPNVKLAQEILGTLKQYRDSLLQSDTSYTKEVAKIYKKLCDFCFKLEDIDNFSSTNLDLINEHANNLLTECKLIIVKTKRNEFELAIKQYDDLLLYLFEFTQSNFTDMDSEFFKQHLDLVERLTVECELAIEQFDLVDEEQSYFDTLFKQVTSSYDAMYNKLEELAEPHEMQTQILINPIQSSSKKHKTSDAYTKEQADLFLLNFDPTQRKRKRQDSTCVGAQEPGTVDLKSSSKHRKRH